MGVCVLPGQSPLTYCRRLWALLGADSRTAYLARHRAGPRKMAYVWARSQLRPPPPIRPTSTVPAPPPGSSVKYPYWYANAVQRCPPGFHLFLAAHLLHKRQWAWRSRAVRSARHHLHVYMYHLELFMYPRFDFQNVLSLPTSCGNVCIYIPTYSHVCGLLSRTKSSWSFGPILVKPYNQIYPPQFPYFLVVVNNYPVCTTVPTPTPNAVPSFTNSDTCGVLFCRRW